MQAQLQAKVQELQALGTAHDGVAAQLQAAQEGMAAQDAAAAAAASQASAALRELQAKLEVQEAAGRDLTATLAQQTSRSEQDAQAAAEQVLLLCAWHLLAELRESMIWLVLCWLEFRDIPQCPCLRSSHAAHASTDGGAMCPDLAVLQAAHLQQCLESEQARIAVLAAEHDAVSTSLELLSLQHASLQQQHADVQVSAWPTVTCGDSHLPLTLHTALPIPNAQPACTHTSRALVETVCAGVHHRQALLSIPAACMQGQLEAAAELQAALETQLQAATDALAQGQAREAAQEAAQAELATSLAHAQQGLQDAAAAAQAHAERQASLQQDLQAARCVPLMRQVRGYQVDHWQHSVQKALYCLRHVDADAIDQHCTSQSVDYSVMSS